MLIKTQVKKVADMPSLTRLVLAFIFAPEKLRVGDIDMMEYSIVNWHKFCSQYEERNLGEEHPFKEQLCWLGSMLKKHADHKLDEQKRTFRLHGINYEHVYGLSTPSAARKAEAKAEYEKYARKNPEQEGLI